MFRRAAVVPIAVALAGLASPARAQDAAAASALFDRGLADMLAGRYQTGCPLLAESHRLNPLPGALFTVAECEARWGRLATALARYQAYLRAFERMTPAEQARQQGREKIAAQQRDALTATVPTLTLMPPAGSPADMVVLRDGVALGRPSFGLALPIDPGEHEIATERPGVGRWARRVTIAPGARVVLPLELPQPSAPPIATSAPLAAAPAPPADAMSGRRAAAWIAGGTGIAGVVLGSITGAVTISKANVADDECIDHVCTDAGKDAADTGKTLGVVSTVAFGVGAAGIVTAVVLLLTEPDAPRALDGTRPRPLALGGLRVDASRGAAGLRIGF